jgi:hypothetical protein
MKSTPFTKVLPDQRKTTQIRHFFTSPKAPPAVFALLKLIGYSKFPI